MLRFYFDAAKVQDGVVTLEEKESRHALRVMRAKAGDPVELLDGHGKSFTGFVVGGEGGRLRVQVDANACFERKHTFPLELIASVIKPDAMEWMIQKACELGVSDIKPVFTERSVVKLPEAEWPKRTARWQKIADAACKQCGLTQIPRVHALSRFSSLKIDAGKTFIPTLSVKGRSLKSALKAISAKGAGVMIGPEGDFTAKEVESATAKGAVPVSLGPLVMRSETAALFALSAIRYHFDED
jgi:16S rRNA (uracil1498-N3)-methyltransferase